MLNHPLRQPPRRGPAATFVPRLARFLPAGLWYALIFWFSSQTAESSGGQSGSLSLRLLGSVSPAFLSADPALHPMAEELLSFPIRKCAHMFLFFVLALLLLYALSRLSAKGWRLVLPLCAVLAALDEFHQTFVPGRSGELRDTLVDLTGSAIALGLLAVVCWGGRRRTRAAWALLVLPAAAALAAVWHAPAGALSSFLAESFVTGFAGLDGGEKARLLAGLTPILQDALAAMACGLLGAFAWLAARLAGSGKALLWGAASVLPAALFAALAGAPAVPAAAGLAGLGGTLAWGLWQAVSFAGAVGRPDRDRAGDPPGGADAG